MGGSGGRAALTPAEAASLQAAFVALQRGDVVGATTAVRAILKAAPASADALHLLALCLRHSGDAAGAVHAFEQALSVAPEHPDVLNNYASQRARMGEPAKAAALYQRALKAAPTRGDIWVNLSIAHMTLRAHRQALDAAEAALRLDPANARALLASASARRELDDLAGAEVALRKAAALNSANGQTWTALGVVLRLRGAPGEALQCYARARALGYASPELEDAEASAELDVGAIASAARRARALTAAAPAYVAGHALLAHILWEHDEARAEGEDPLAPITQAAAAQPRHHALRMALADLLLEANRPAHALEELAALRREADTPQAAAAHAMALEQLGEIGAAETVYADAIARMGAPQGMNSAYAHT
ncbi:MAG TPA: tetratricopeptide repeat protein, partial [Terricaulis sp.]|nr:tetratricopeptide repeat protein [Terricaulis sp.]